jgi:hypothetical protein
MKELGFVSEDCILPKLLVGLVLLLVIFLIAGYFLLSSPGDGQNISGED